MGRIPEDTLRSLIAAAGIETWSWISPAELPSDERTLREEAYHRWIDDGMHGGMDYLVRHAPRKYRPEQIVPGAGTLLVMLFPYYQELPSMQQQVRNTAGNSRQYTGGEIRVEKGLIARYAWGRDYHRIIKKKLKSLIAALSAYYPNDRFRGFTDTGPLDERFFSARAELGHLGRNGMLISPRFGSWVFIAEIITTLQVDHQDNRSSGLSTIVYGGNSAGSQPSGKIGPAPSPPAACPPTCSLCRQSCPTGALRPDGGFDARKCISYLTIEHDGPIPTELRPLIGSRLFGCDTCQEVCPLNRSAEATGVPGFLTHIAGPALELGDLLTIRSREQMVQRFAGSPLMRLSLVQLLRNAIVAAGNSGSVELLPLLRPLAESTEGMLTEHAEWAIKQLQGVGGAFEGV